MSSSEHNEKALSELYRHALVEDVLPFWLRFGLDREHGGVITALDRDGSILDTDKVIWFQGRAAWMYATAFLTVERRPEWLDAAKSCIAFLRQFASDASGKMYFLVSRTGQPLRMRRYVYSESFAAIASAAYAGAAGDGRAADEAVTAFDRYIDHSFTPGRMEAKVDPSSRPMIGAGPRMIGIATAQEIRQHLGEIRIRGRTPSEWIDCWIDDIERLFFKPELGAMMETVAPDGAIIDHYDGRLLNPGHAIEASWFIMHEGRHRADQRLVRLGAAILECMWKRGWDEHYGGLFYFRDLRNLPVQEYWQDMKFWWPHNEAVIATLLAWKLTGDPKFREMHRAVHDWSFEHFADSEHGEWARLPPPRWNTQQPRQRHVVERSLSPAADALVLPSPPDA
ncbi:MAG: AGE family epimerase/isomerase [Opitutaceae bacterium]